MIPAGEQNVPHSDTDITLPHPHARPCVVGICGPEGTGKDTTAEAIMPWLKKHYKAACITSFAEPIYQMVSIFTGLPIEQLKHRETKEALWTPELAPLVGLAGHSPRSILRDIGMWARERFSQQYWVDHLEARTRYGGWWLITDVRFNNEAMVCDFVIEVRRDGIHYRNDHPSSYRIRADLIDHIEHLTPGMDYVGFGQKITRLIAEKQAEGLEPKV